MFSCVRYGAALAAVGLVVACSTASTSPANVAETDESELNGSSNTSTSLLLAYQANDPGHQLYLSKATVGLNLVQQTSGASYEGASAVWANWVGTSPALTIFHDRLHVAYQAKDDSHALYVGSSSGDASFAVKKIGDSTLTGAPALAVFHDRLYVAYRADDGSNQLVLTSSSDGTSFSPAIRIPTIAMGSAPALVETGGQLVVGYQGNDPSHSIYLARTGDGATFAPPAKVASDIATGTAPAFTVTSDSHLMLGYQQEGTHRLVLRYSTDSGMTFSNSGIGTFVGSAPALAAVRNASADGTTSYGVAVAYQANDPSHTLYVLLTNTLGQSIGLNRSFGAQSEQVGSAPAMVSLPRTPPTPPPPGAKCSGLPTGASCSSDSSCCHEMCKGGKCAACVPAGKACAHWFQCCTGICSTDGDVGSCACIAPGKECSSNAECCDGSCNQVGQNGHAVCN